MIEQKFSNNQQLKAHTHLLNNKIINIIMAKLIADKSLFVVVGAWNPAIFQAEWINKEFPEFAASFQIEVELPTNNLRFNFGDFYLSVANNRLILIPKGEITEAILIKIADFAKKIFVRLNHTPIIVAGSNFFFQLDKDEEFSSQEVETEPDISNLPEKLANTKLISRSIKHTLSKDDFNINIIYEFLGKERGLLINFDYPRLPDAMNKAANSLIENLRCANYLAKNLIK